MFLVCLCDWLFGYFGGRIVVFGFGIRRDLGGVGNLVVSCFVVGFEFLRGFWYFGLFSSC